MANIVSGSTSWLELGLIYTYPTYPGMGSWVSTNYEQDLSGDYRLAEKNVPASRFAVMYEITQSFDLDGGQFLVPVIPTFASTLIPVTTLVPITVRTSYRNWLNNGLASDIIAFGEAVQSGIRPPTFNYQVMSKYKEVVHYGFDMVLLAAGTSIGTIVIFSLVSFIPFLEHRMQCSFEPTVLLDGLVSDVAVNDSDQLLFTMNWSIEVEAIKFDSPIKMTVYTSYVGKNKLEFNIVGIDDKGRLITDAQEGLYESEEPFNIVNGTIGNYFILSSGIQIKDPSMLYSEMADDDGKYYKEGDYGYETREQSVSSSAEITSFLYDRDNMEKLLLEIVDQMEKEEEEEEDNSGQTDGDDQQDSASEDDDKHAIDVRFSDADISETKALLEYVTSADEVWGAYAEQRLDDDDNGKLLLSAVRALQGDSTYIKVPISSTPLSDHNFSAGTQIGSVFNFNNGEAYYKILDHPRSGLFLVLNTPVGGSDKGDLQEKIYDNDDAEFSINSRNMWTVNDVMTSRNVSSASFDTGSFSGEILFSELVDKYDYDSNVPSGEREKVTLLTYAIGDDDYYGFEYLRNRYLVEVDNNGTVIKSWVDYGGWVLYRRGSERSTAYEIEYVSFDSDEIIYITLKEDISQFSPDSDGYEENVNAKWWIGFNSMISINPDSFDYVGTPTLKLHALRSDDAVLIHGGYIGSPVEIPLEEDAVISVIADYPVIPGPDLPSGIRVSSARPFKYISFDEEPTSASEVILYTRDDDASNALYAREGQLDFLYGINEFLLYSGEPEIVEAKVTGPLGKFNVQTLSYDDSDSDLPSDIVGVKIVKKEEEDEEADAGKYEHTIWYIHHGDKPLGYRSQSGLESTVYSRASDIDAGTEIDNILFYHFAQLFSRKDAVPHAIPGNASTNDPLVTGSQFKFIPALNWNSKHSVIGKAFFEKVPFGKVMRNVNSRAVFPYEGGNRIILANQPQNLTNLENDQVSIELALSGNNIGAPDVDIQQEGVFLLSTNNRYRNLEPGFFFGGLGDGVLLESVPFSLSPNMSECSYSLTWPYVDIAGYSKESVGDGVEMMALKFRRINIMSLLRSSFYMVKNGDENLFSVPSGQVYISSVNVIGTFRDDDDESPSIFLDSDLAIEPFDMASDGKYSIIVKSDVNAIRYLVSTSAGQTWSYFDDMNIISNGQSVSSPHIRIINDIVHLFYFQSGSDLMYRRIPISYFGALVKRYGSKRSSDEEEEEWTQEKQELQALFNNIESIKLVESFEQKVAFGISFRNRYQVVYYDDDGYVASAVSYDSGITWTSSVINF